MKEQDKKPIAPRFFVGPEDERYNTEAWKRFKQGNKYYALRT
tara:strand:+ start:313 stop:438 length:126 start_codon:yes stop_codon:yes gene_type:complete